MAKGLRSKSLRKSKAIRCQKIFKPVVDARTERLAIKERLSSVGIAMIPEGCATNAGESPASVAPVTPKEGAAEVFRSKKSGKVSRKHGKHARSALNSYGIPAKELSF
jgi:hypothetical protein